MDHTPEDWALRSFAKSTIAHVYVNTSGIFDLLEVDLRSGAVVDGGRFERPQPGSEVLREIPGISRTDTWDRHSPASRLYKPAKWKVGNSPQEFNRQHRRKRSAWWIGGPVRMSGIEAHLDLRAGRCMASNEAKDFGIK